MQDDFRREAARMLRICQRDLKPARAMLDGEIFDEATWGFQIQQATGKALKAWISCLDHGCPFIHDLAVLRRLITDFGVDPESRSTYWNQFSPGYSPMSGSCWDERSRDLYRPCALRPQA
jgi:HEPN domain-containing protein